MKIDGPNGFPGNMPEEWREKIEVVSSDLPQEIYDSRERFGNALFVDEGVAVVTRENTLTFGATLATPDGQELIKNQPEILRYVEKAIEILERDPETSDYIRQLAEHVFIESGMNPAESRSEYALKLPDSLAQAIYLDDEKKVRLTVPKTGNQNQMFILETPFGEYAFKHTNIARSLTRDSHNIQQPYINETVQLQMINERVGPQLEELGFKINIPLIVNNQYTLSEYVEGAGPDSGEEFIAKLHVAAGLIEKTIRNYNTQSPNAIMDSIHPDMFQYSDGSIRYPNIIKDARGLNNFVDTVFYFKPEMATHAELPGLVTAGIVALPKEEYEKIQISTSADFVRRYGQAYREISALERRMMEMKDAGTFDLPAINEMYRNMFGEELPIFDGMKKVRPGWYIIAIERDILRKYQVPFMSRGYEGKPLQSGF